MLQETEKDNVLALQSLEMEWADVVHNCLSIASTTSTANPYPCD
jgi:hypothetical protein